MKLQLFFITFPSLRHPVKENQFPRPTVCLTFDDGNPNDVGGYPWDIWNKMLLDHLKRSYKNVQNKRMGHSKLIRMKYTVTFLTRYLPEKV
jgi:hypothetical protein